MFFSSDKWTGMGSPKYIDPSAIEIVSMGHRAFDIGLLIAVQCEDGRIFATSGTRECFPDPMPFGYEADFFSRNNGTPFYELIQP